MATRRQVEAALEAETRKIDAANRGSHVFDPIWASDEGACNWTTNFRVIGSSVPLDDMRAALERVQARLPVVDFGKA